MLGEVMVELELQRKHGRYYRTSGVTEIIGDKRGTFLGSQGTAAAGRINCCT